MVPCVTKILLILIKFKIIAFINDVAVSCQLSPEITAHGRLGMYKNFLSINQPVLSILDTLESKRDGYLVPMVQKMRRRVANHTMLLETAAVKGFSKKEDTPPPKKKKKIDNK